MKFRLITLVLVSVQELCRWLNEYSTSHAGGRFKQLVPYKTEIVPSDSGDKLNIGLKTRIKDKYKQFAWVLDSEFWVECDEALWMRGGQTALQDLLEAMIRHRFIDTWESSFSPGLSASEIIERSVPPRQVENLGYPRTNKLALTNRQLDVADYIADGLKHEEISTKLSISRYTVRTHASMIGEAVKDHYDLKELKRGELPQLLRELRYGTGSST